MLVALLLFLIAEQVSSTALPSSLRQSSYAARNAPVLISEKPGDGGHVRDPISEWSSTIGIVTAIVGNVLISVALNIQRYAHVRIEREYEGNILRLRAEWKRSSSSPHRPDGPTNGYKYGTADRETARNQEDVGTSRYTDDPEEDERRPRKVYTNGNGHAHAQGRENQASEDEETDDPLQSSFLSDRTATSFEKSIAGVDRKSYLRSSYWWFGIILMTVGEAGNFLAYGFAPASIVSPLGVVALVSNCVIAPFMLKERFRQRDLLGVVIAVAGAVIVVLSAKTSENKIGPDEIWGMITRWEFETYLGITVILIIGLMSISRKYGRKTILIDVGLVGLFGGYTALSTKGVSSLLSNTLWHAITFPITYVLVAVLVFSAVMQIRYINRALQHFNSTQVIPTQFVLFTLSVIMGSAILYRDFESATGERVAKFVGGCLLTFFAVYLITSGRVQKEDESESESETDEEEAIGLQNEEPYRDYVDWQQDSAPIPRRQGTDSAGQGTRTKPSPSRSLQSLEEVYEPEDEDDGQLTPRARISASPGSLLPPISSASSILDPSPLPAISNNPWATPSSEREGPDFLSGSPGKDTLAHSADVYPPPTNVILQFPAAPGATDSPPRISPPQHGPQTPQGSPRRRSPTRADHHGTHKHSNQPLRTPGTVHRNSLSRFSPGPLLPPLSGGLSAVVADSLRRGEGSPQQLRKSLRGSSRHRSKNRVRAGIPLYLDPALDSHPVAEAEDETTGIIACTTRNIPQISRSTSTTGPDAFPSEQQRIRSLSDSWSGGLLNFGGNLRLSGRRSKGKLPAAENLEEAASRQTEP
ncbi:non-imprinted in Prader-Willi/Angelman syndrome region protein 1 [Nannizzia gypsea CBS 118893]|uniref:Non-imprinted in Prader-Willi/Angelman syndrome region protein 1 n=1 Tax=Arthroderma gypseum (strain ATCC MYA-4604 / CBS 118893) TaxID=535722 RepID=E4UT26_ARTGP|nr:non-imprinted in Prader-Willi/Angelman syndrome region protein 1 [Nannizzia gypsea CBS 118893]EFR00639.1 non-imprinted in Prader-Willi/Angelman syndrome region protein 1 [Nannizzia gypsea CBS 118893]